MPLVMVSGYPCSGKTTRVKQLADHLRSKGKAVSIIDCGNVGIDRQETYSSPQLEKNTRGALKAAVERNLSKDTVLIADDLNYIKGFRYELHCIAKAVGTTCCTLHCDGNEDQLIAFNQQENRYPNEIIKELVARYERPNDRNRWERPLFVIRPEDELMPLDDITSVIEGESLNPNLATVSQPVADKNLLHEIDVATGQILEAVQRAQGDGAPAGVVKTPHGSKPLTVSRIVPIAEQRRIKRQFLKVVTDDGQTPSSVAVAADMFLDFFTRQIAAEH